MNILNDLDPSRYVLGGLCNRGHDYNNTGKTLRTKSGSCPLCKKQNAKEAKERDPVKFAESARKKGLKHYYNHRDRQLLRMQKWREENREYHRQATREWYNKNRDYALQYSAEYKSREDVRERAKELSKARRLANPSKAEHISKERKKRIAQSNDKTITTQFLVEEFEKTKKCVYCGCKLNEDNKSLDHLIPLIRGGLHSRSNVIVCCLTCNLKKNDKSFPDWLERLDEPHKTNATQMYVKKHGQPPLQLTLPLKFV